MAGSITLPCAIAAGDQLVVADLAGSDSAGAGGVVLIASATVDGQEGAIYLTEQQARNVFNWLGVWLHGGNRS